MSKELVIYEKRDGRYVTPDDLFSYRPAHAKGYAKDKRFTDAELAAEYWKVIGGLYDGNGRKSRTRSDTLYRFATTPSYDEDAA